MNGNGNGNGRRSQKPEATPLLATGTAAEYGSGTGISGGSNSIKGINREISNSFLDLSSRFGDFISQHTGTSLLALVVLWCLVLSCLVFRSFVRTRIFREDQGSSSTGLDGVIIMLYILTCTLMLPFVHLGSIGYLGSMSIAVNSLTGPAMLNLPATFSKSGIIPTIFTLVFVCILSALCCLHMSNTISKVPHNHNFKKEIEYSEAFQYFWGRNWFVATQVLFFCCITCLNISSIVDTAHVVDTFLGHWWPASLGGASVALQIVSISEVHVVKWDYEDCSDSTLALGKCLPFYKHLGDGSILLTAGNLITSIVFFPMALMDLKENAAGQIFGFLVLLVTSTQFVVQFAMSGNMDWERAELWGHDWDDLLGVVLFNFALVIAIPAWLYEREPHVDVPTVINGSSVLAVILYISLGLVCHLAVPHVSSNMVRR
jgi:hypothetical protein